LNKSPPPPLWDFSIPKGPSPFGGEGWKKGGRLEKRGKVGKKGEGWKKGD